MDNRTEKKKKIVCVVIILLVVIAGTVIWLLHHFTSRTNFLKDDDVEVQTETETEKKLHAATESIENASRKTRTIERKLRRVEALDEAYYNAIPPLEQLADLYGDPDGDALYRQRDLFHRYQRRYIREHGLALYDVTDERQSGGRRF